MEKGRVAPPFLNSALDIEEWSASRSGGFTVGYTAPGTHGIVPRTGVDLVWKRRIICLCRESKPESLAVYPIACHHNVTWMATALLGNGPVNTSRLNTLTQQ
jgi:hypothetical protein